ncbi:MAG: hypothetical protein ACPGOY_00065 [Rhodospirillaceae bacterium]
MKVFPGSFPPSEYKALSLEELAEVYDLATRVAEAEADAMRAARSG